MEEGGRFQSIDFSEKNKIPYYSSNEAHLHCSSPSLRLLFHPPYPLSLAY